MEKLSADVEALCRDRIYHYFRRLSDIPRRSFHEKAVSDYIYNWALEHGWNAERDAVYNVFIHKAASPGCENAPTVMLQAHLDMVCEKRADSPHDFSRDAIPWRIEGDVLSTGGETTLGADDGIGVALAMAVLEREDLRHPPLEVLFTTREEENFGGALHFDRNKMSATRLINLDNTEEKTIVSGSCGGMRAEVKAGFPLEAVREDCIPVELSIKGLLGGHSGEDIHRGRGNANLLLIRALWRLSACCSYQLGCIRGGSFRLAIPREASALLWIPAGELKRAGEVAAELETQYRSELAHTAGKLKLTLTECRSEQPDAGLAKRQGVEPDPLLPALLLMPDGIVQMSEAFEGIVDTSVNLGELYLNDGALRLVFEIRSLRESLRDLVYERIEQAAKPIHGSCSFDTVYPSWDFFESSKLRETYLAAFRGCGGERPKALTVHAGLEVSYFFREGKELDAISVGPDIRNFHSPSEWLCISSAKRVYRYLCETLAALA